MPKEFTTTPITDGVWHIQDARGAVMHLVTGDKHALLIDTGFGEGDLPAHLAMLTDLPITVVNDSPITAGGTWRCNVAPGRSQKTWAFDGHRYAAPVGSYPTGITKAGVHDLAGNVMEWCVDWYAADAYRSGDATNPRGPETGTERVVRGGAFSLAPTYAYSFRRMAREPDEPDINLGFRVVREAAPPSER